jgi:hypothetical protein
MSSQSPVVLWYREVNCEVGMWVEAVPVLGAESVDFLFNPCDLKILSEDHIRHVPWCVGYHAQDFPLEAFQYFDDTDLLWNVISFIILYAFKMPKTKCVLTEKLRTKYPFIIPCNCYGKVDKKVKCTQCNAILKLVVCILLRVLGQVQGFRLTQHWFEYFI